MMNQLCSFCRVPLGKKNMVQGISANICYDCIEVCQNLMQNQKKIKTEENIISPKLIKQFLDQFIINQEQAKIKLAVLIFNHLKRLDYNSMDDDIEIKKSNAIIVGPSGSGKTFLIESLTKYINLPIVIVDATTLTQNGYSGTDIENIMSLLLEEADGNINLAQRGIVYLDEIDKKSKNITSGLRDIAGEGVQQGLLKIIEGSKVRIKSNNGVENEIIFDTTNVLFIGGGAFVGIEEIIKKRNNSINVGFYKYNNNAENNASIEPEDLISYGLLPELVGRIPLIIELKKLEKSDIKKIMLDSKNSIIREYQKIFRYHGITLEFTDSLIDRIAEKTYAHNTGARALKMLFDKFLTVLQYNLENYKQDNIKKIILDYNFLDTSIPILEK